MGTLRLVYTLPSGIVHVLCPAPAFVAMFATERAALEALFPTIPTSATNAQILDSAVLPNRRFRDCWRRAGAEAPTVDMSLARVQRRNEIQRECDKRLAASIPAVLNAREQGDVMKEAAWTAYRQALRALPASAQTACETHTTPTQLDAWTPEWPTTP